MRTRGMSLVEVLVAVGIGSVVILGAFRLSMDQTKLLSDTSSQLEMFQSARTGIELLTYDLQMAGAGVGYRADGRFAGLDRGSFTGPGGAQFLADDRAISIQGAEVRTDDVGVLRAYGKARTVAAHVGDTLEVCAGSGLERDDLAMLVSRDGIYARSMKVADATPTMCTDGVCVAGCTRLRITPDPSYASHPDAISASYVDGEVVGQLERIVWFVTPGFDGRGALRRTDNRTPCAAADDRCGGTVATGIESIQLRVFQWDATSQAWVETTLAPAIEDRRRVRVDLEIVANARPDAQARLERTVLRTSVEVRNSARHEMR